MNLFISSGISGKLVFARALKCMLQAILRVEVIISCFFNLFCCGKSMIYHNLLAAAAPV